MTTNTGVDRPAGRTPSQTNRDLLWWIPVLTGVLSLGWYATIANGGGDLAAQDAWTAFVARYPTSAYDLSWYGGMHPMSYSVVAPYLMSALGVRTTLMLAGALSAALFTGILLRLPLRQDLAGPALLGVCGIVGNLLSGRATFALGTVFALCAVAVVFCWPHRWMSWRRSQIATTALCAALATMSSPVAGLFLGLLAAALFLQRRWAQALSLGLPPTVVVLILTWAFPFSGVQPMPFGSTLIPVALSVASFLVVPQDWKTVRITSVIYGLSILLAWLIPSQIGSNITRMALMFAGVVLVAALPRVAPRGRKWQVTVACLALFVSWIGVKTVTDVAHTRPEQLWTSGLTPLLSELEAEHAERGRVEVIPVRSHREASALAPYVNLARGWNRQADAERNPLFYDKTLNADTYGQWLDRWAVRLVVVANEQPDSAAQQEHSLVQQGLPYLDLAWSDQNWKVYRVDRPTPLAEPDTQVQRAGQDELILDVRKAGRILVRIPYSPWLSLVDGQGERLDAPPENNPSIGSAYKSEVFGNVNGCLIENDQDTEGDRWTTLVAPGPGTYRIAARYGFPRGTPCPDGLK